MHITGTIINVVLILIGGFIGIFLGNRFSESLRHSVMMALGLFTVAYAIRLFLQTGNALIFGTAINLPTLTSFDRAEPPTDSHNARISEKWYKMKDRVK